MTHRSTEFRVARHHQEGRLFPFEVRKNLEREGYDPLLAGAQGVASEAPVVEEHSLATLILEVGLHLEAVDLADVLDGEVQRDLFAALDAAIAVAFDVVRHLQPVREPRLGEGLNRGAHLDGRWGMPVRLFEVDMNRIGAIDHVARDAADALVIFGNAVAKGRRPRTRLPRSKFTEHQLTPFEPGVVASGGGA